jgi:multiple sugar transport system ATP-binding protein
VRRTARVDLVLPTGARTYATFTLGATPVVAELQAHDASQVGEQLDLAIDMNRAVLIDPETERVIS